MSLKSALKTSVTPRKTKNTLLKSNLDSSKREKADIIKGVLKKHGYISDPVVHDSGFTYDDVFIDDEQDAESALESAFKELDCSQIQDLSKDNGDFELAVETMLSEDRQETSGEVSSSLLKPTVAYAEGTYKGKKFDGLWRPPEGIISPPSAKLCRTTKAVEAHKYDEARRALTPSRSKSWNIHTTNEKTMQADADMVFKEARALMSSMMRDDIKNDPTKPTAAAINSRYKRLSVSDLDPIWHAPAVILPPSNHLLKPTESLEHARWRPDPSRAVTPEAKREKAWRRTHASKDILDSTSVCSLTSARSLSSSRSRSTERTVFTTERISALNAPNAAQRNSIEALAKERQDKIAKPIKKQALMTNQRILNPTYAILAYQHDAEHARSSVKPEDDPWWDKREGKVIPRPTSAKFAAVQAKVFEPVTKPLRAAAVPLYRPKSPTPFKPPSQSLLRLTENDFNRSKAHSEVRSLSARSTTSRSGSISSRSLTPSERLTQPTDSYINYQKSKTPQEAVVKRDRKAISPDLIERLERKTASIVYNQWSGSSAEKEAMLELERQKKMRQCAERSATPTGTVSGSLLRHTDFTAKLVRTKSPGRPVEKDPLIVGDCWVDVSRSPVRLGEGNISELTSSNYRKRTPTPMKKTMNRTTKENMDRENVSADGRTVFESSSRSASGRSSPSLSESSIALA